MDALQNKIQYSDKNRGLFGSFIAKKSHFAQSIPVSDDCYSWDTYKKALKNKKSKEFRFTVAGTVTLLLGGAGIIFGKGRNYNKIAENLDLIVKALREKVQSSTPRELDKVKLKVVNSVKQGLDYVYAADKIKDSSFLQGFKKLGKPGEWIINASKGSLKITGFFAKLRHSKSAKNINNLTDDLEKILRENKASLNSEDERKMLENLLNTLKGKKGGKGLKDFADDLAKGFEERAKKIKNAIETHNIKPYLEKYLPKSPFKKEEWKKVGKNWKEVFLRDSNKDVLRENWQTTDDILLQNIRLTGGQGANFGNALDKFDDVLKAMNKSSKKGNSETFLKIRKQAKEGRKSISDAIDFETNSERYAGRVLDLSAGGGIPEILVPPVAGGIITYHTLKDVKPEERKEKFIKSGGAAFVGGLFAWVMASNMLAISGPSGMLIGLASGLMMNQMSKMYLKYSQK